MGKNSWEIEREIVQLAAKEFVKGEIIEYGESMFAEDYWEQIIMDCSNIKITATGSIKKTVNSSRSFLV